MHASVLSYHGNRCPVSGVASLLWTANCWHRICFPHWGIPVCLFLPSSVAPQRLSIFLNDLSLKLADRFYDKEKLKFRSHHHFFLMADVTISNVPWMIWALRRWPWALRKVDAIFQLVTCAFSWKLLGPWGIRNAKGSVPITRVTFEGWNFRSVACSYKVRQFIPWTRPSKSATWC